MKMKVYNHGSNSTKVLLPLARKLRTDMTDAEHKLWRRIRNNQLGVKFRRQTVFDHYILDFYAVQSKLVIEVDGGQHYTEEGRVNDNKRDAYLKEHGIDVLRYSDIEVLKSTDDVIEAVLHKIKEKGKTLS